MAPTTSRHANNDRHYRPVPVGSRESTRRTRSPPANLPARPHATRTNSRGGIKKPGQRPSSQSRRLIDSWTRSPSYYTRSEYSSRSGYSTQSESSRSDCWYVPVPEMDSYFDAIRNNRNTGQNLDPRLHEPEVAADRRRQAWKYRTEDVVRQFDVSLKHVQDLLWHMWNRYDTVACYSTTMLQPGDMIYYISPFTLGPDQDVKGESAAYLGGSRFQAGVQAKGRFAIVLKVIGHHVKVVPVNTFNGEGLASKPERHHAFYVDVHDPSHYHFNSVSPHQPLEVRKAFCEMKPNAAAHLVTMAVTLSQKIMIAGSIMPESLERLKGLVQMTEG